MKQITTILNKLLVIAQNGKVWLRVLVFVVVATGCIIVGAVYYSKSKCEDCRPYQKIAQDLITALSDKAVAYEVNESPYMTAVYYPEWLTWTDTTKPMPIKQYNKYKDSVLKHYQKKLDSLKTKQ
jgi:hypothetical protein